MSLSAAQMQWFADRGFGLSDAAEFVRLGEAAQKSKAALRTEKWRAKKEAENVTRDVTVTHPEAEAEPSQNVTVTSPVTVPHVRVLDKPLTKVLTGSVVVVDASAQGDDWPKVKNIVTHLVEQIDSPWLDPSKSPALIQTGARILAWKQAGASWEHDVIPVVTTACLRTRVPIGRWAFFDPAIGQSIADNRKALEIPAARATGPPGGSFVDRLTADNNEARRRVLSG